MSEELEKQLVTFEEMQRQIVEKNLQKLSMRKGKFRSTYNEKTAFEFRPAFDYCIAENKDNLVLYTDYYQISPLTLHKKMNDALKWLVENLSDEESAPYKILRSRCRIVMSDEATEGIFIRLHAGPGNMLRGTPVPTVNTQWREQFFAWLENPGAGPMLNLENLNISLDDKAMVEKTIEDINIGKPPEACMIAKISLNQIRIHR